MYALVSNDCECSSWNIVTTVIISIPWKFDEIPIVHRCVSPISFILEHFGGWISCVFHVFITYPKLAYTPLYWNIESTESINDFLFSFIGANKLFIFHFPKSFFNWINSHRLNIMFLMFHHSVWNTIRLNIIGVCVCVANI